MDRRVAVVVVRKSGNPVPIIRRPLCDRWSSGLSCSSEEREEETVVNDQFCTLAKTLWRGRLYSKSCTDVQTASCHIVSNESGVIKLSLNGTIDFWKLVLHFQADNTWTCPIRLWRSRIMFGNYCKPANCANLGQNTDRSLAYTKMVRVYERERALEGLVS